jgi:hypothetical protein
MISSFRGRLWFFQGEHEFELIPWQEMSGAEEQFALPARRAAYELDWALPRDTRSDEYFLRQALLDVCQESNFVSRWDAPDLSTDELRRVVVAATEQGALRLLQRRREWPVAQAAARRPDQVAAQPQSDESTWVEIECVDEDGDPYQGVVQIELPDGVKTPARADEKGRIWIRSDLAGRCKITIDELHEQDWSLA